ncbi:MAG: hypothetical protein M0P01_04475 [Treponema sp.]|nr:hypothetical protein [Treponema sp.]
MCKKFSTVCCAAFFPVVLAAQPVQTAVSATDPYGVDFSKLSGRPALVTEYRGDELDDLVLRSASNYDKGLLTSVQLYDENGRLKSSTRYNYSENKLLTGITGTDTNGIPRWKYIYTYDTSGRQKEESSFSGTDTLEWKAVSSYNPGGQLTSRITYDNKNAVTLRESFKYNDRNFIYADITQFPDGKVLKRIIYTYTAGGHVAFEDHYDSSGFYEQVGYSYTDNGNLTSFSYVDKKGKLKSRTVLQYGRSGMIENEKIYEEGRNLSADITYVYDSRGNWIWKYDGQTYTLRKIIYGE